ncbi:hypothetical protein [Citrobacter meridianamericanus]|uniref:hypothetical protein n=1 Tax=Citrobacter meridianamericanus TaxID=2894201 RepID=UPI00351DA1E5
MVLLERKDISKGKTVVLIGAGVTVVVVVAIFAITLEAGFAAIPRESVTQTNLCRKALHRVWHYQRQLLPVI